MKGTEFLKRGIEKQPEKADKIARLMIEIKHLKKQVSQKEAELGKLYTEQIQAIGNESGCEEELEIEI